MTVSQSLCIDEKNEDRKKPSRLTDIKRKKSVNSTLSQGSYSSYHQPHDVSNQDIIDIKPRKISDNNPNIIEKYSKLREKTNFCKKLKYQNLHKNETITRHFATPVSNSNEYCRPPDYEKPSVAGPIHSPYSVEYSSQQNVNDESSEQIRCSSKTFVSNTQTLNSDKKINPLKNRLKSAYPSLFVNSISVKNSNNSLSTDSSLISSEDKSVLNISPACSSVSSSTSSSKNLHSNASPIFKCTTSSNKPRLANSSAKQQDKSVQRPFTNDIPQLSRTKQSQANNTKETNPLTLSYKPSTNSPTEASSSSKSNEFNGRTLVVSPSNKKLDKHRITSDATGDLRENHSTFSMCSSNAKCDEATPVCSSHSQSSFKSDTILESTNYIGEDFRSSISVSSSKHREMPDSVENSVVTKTCLRESISGVSCHTTTSTRMPVFGEYNNRIALC